MKKHQAEQSQLLCCQAGNMMFPHFLDEVSGEHNLLAWQDEERAKSCFLMTFFCTYFKMKGEYEQHSQITLLQVITVIFVSQQTLMWKVFRPPVPQETRRSLLHFCASCLWLFSLQLWQTRTIILLRLPTDGFDFHHSNALFPSRTLNCYFKWATNGEIRCFGGRWVGGHLLLK